MSAKRNTVVTFAILIGCLVLGYLYASIFYAPEEEVVKPTTANTEIVVAKTPTKDYFEEYRLERDRLRSRQVELLREIVNNPNSSVETRKEAQTKLMGIVDRIDTEGQVENILIARGFKDAVMLIRPENITVIIKANSLIQEDTDKVEEIVSQITGMSNEDIIVLSKR